jgi:isoleucyl-tRNA synthetase
VVDDLSNWWVRQTRARFWAPGRKADPAALATLHDVLCVVMRLLAPAAPFLPDLLHRALTGASVHTAPFPEVKPSLDDPVLERAMDAVRRLASLARSARETAGIKVRQPLARMLAAVPPDVAGPAFAALLPVLAGEVNVKKLEMVAAGTDLVSLEAEPSFRALGKRFGSATPEAAAAIRRLSAADVARYELGERVEITVQGTAHALEPGDLKIKRHAKGDLVVVADGEMIAAIDPAVNDELKDEGLAREIVSRVQRLRKDAGYNIADRIHLWVDGDAPVVNAARRHADYIAGETLAVGVHVANGVPTPPADLTQDFELDGIAARIAVRRAG